MEEVVDLTCEASETSVVDLTSNDSVMVLCVRVCVHVCVCARVTHPTPPVVCWAATTDPDDPLMTPDDLDVDDDPAG